MKRIHTLSTIAAAALLMLAAGATHAQRTVEVTVTNLTSDQILSPPIAFSHLSGFGVFEPGEEASAELAAVAEDADSTDLIALLEADAAVQDVAIGGDVIMPGASMPVVLEVTGNMRDITVLSMLVTTNDAFYAGSGRVPDRRVVYAPAWDAGSEANTEDCDHIPGPPCDNPGVRVTDGAEGFVHIHSGIHGIADLPSEVWDWRNPVARIEISRPGP